ncbi:hexokinase [Treponema sp. OMZ 787]|uniref:hexokinase family protein n=1 Tax=Treponema sp. OMZ 787 TaxID=2563669 RepID=UPI0020A4BF04|nr:hexokinase [Treponema sp. OMZ 787]UTC63142.1 hexokinase [Treponema sp. OMZ 787]
MKVIDDFFKRNNFDYKIDIEYASSILLEDMKKGLESNFETASSMDMIPLWKNLPDSVPKDKKVIIIDAGGTNFRAGLVYFDKKGVPEIISFFKHPMPAIDREMTNEEFFDSIAEYLEPLRDEAEVISFCFSYAVKIFPDGGGQAIKLSKEIKLPHIADCKINEGLLQALSRKNWTRVKKVIMVNDTAAVLQSGIFSETNEQRFDSHVGIVLGTGLNSAYIEYDKIEKLKDTEFYNKPQIIVCESGKSNKIPQSKFDKNLSENSNLKNEYFLERMCSGRYLGELCSIALRTGAAEGIFSPRANKMLLNSRNFSSEEISLFLKEQNHKKNIFSDIIDSGAVSADYVKIYFICKCVFERAARLSAAVIGAACIKTGKGKSPDRPICVSADGSMFLKGFLIKERIFKSLHTCLTEKKGIYFVLKTNDDAVTLGTALAAFLN